MFTIVDIAKYLMENIMVLSCIDYLGDNQN